MKKIKKKQDQILYKEDKTLASPMKTGTGRGKIFNVSKKGYVSAEAAVIFKEKPYKQLFL